MTSFVLVHGAWHGGWCWQRVTPLLQDAGHEVFTPTLTGLGERAHLFRADIDLDTHIQDVVALMEAEDLRDVVLVGHSYAGAVVAGVADRAAARIARMVYLDAFVLRNDQSLVDLIAPERQQGLRATSEAVGIPPFPPQGYGISDPADVAWVGPKLGNHPLRTFTRPLRLSNPPLRVPHLYIECTQPAMGPFTPIAAALRRNPAWKVVELKTGHDAMVTAPRALTELLRAG